MIENPGRLPSAPGVASRRWWRFDPRDACSKPEAALAVVVHPERLGLPIVKKSLNSFDGVRVVPVVDNCKRIESAVLVGLHDNLDGDIGNAHPVGLAARQRAIRPGALSGPQSPRACHRRLVEGHDQVVFDAIGSDPSGVVVIQTKGNALAPRQVSGYVVTARDSAGKTAIMAATNEK
jgi:hypothetical protein